MRQDLFLYLLTSPFLALTDQETPLQSKIRAEKFDKLSINIRQIMIALETSNIIKETIINKNHLTLDHAEKTAYLIRLVFFGKLAISDFINKLAADLRIDRELAKNIALAINQEIFRQAASELREIQRNFAAAAREESRQTSHGTPQSTLQTTYQPPPPLKLPALEEEYMEKRNEYLEPINENDQRQKPLIEGNVINLKSNIK